MAFLGAATDAYTTALRGLSRTARTILEETGANNLYLSVGNLRWTSGAKELWSPLVLIPVTLRPVRGGYQYRLSLDDTGTSTPNYSLLERLRKEFDLEIPGFAEPVEDGAGLDIDALFTAIRTAMTQARLPFTVEPHVDLAILQFGKFRLWKDIDEAWETDRSTVARPPRSAIAPGRCTRPGHLNRSVARSACVTAGVAGW